MLFYQHKRTQYNRRQRANANNLNLPILCILLKAGICFKTVCLYTHITHAMCVWVYIYTYVCMFVLFYQQKKPYMLQRYRPS